MAYGTYAWIKWLDGFEAGQIWTNSLFRVGVGAYADACADACAVAIVVSGVDDTTKLLQLYRLLPQAGSYESAVRREIAVMEDDAETLEALGYYFKAGVIYLNRKRRPDDGASAQRCLWKAAMGGYEAAVVILRDRFFSIDRAQLELAAEHTQSAVVALCRQDPAMLDQWRGKLDLLHQVTVLQLSGRFFC